MSQFKVNNADQQEYDGDLRELDSKIAALGQRLTSQATTKRVAGTGTTSYVPSSPSGGSGGSPTTITIDTPGGLTVNGAQSAAGVVFTLANGVTGILRDDGAGGYTAAIAGTDYVAPGETIATTGGIVGGGDLSAPRTFALSNYSGATTGYVPSTDGAGGLTWIAPGGGGGGSGTVTSFSAVVPSWLTQSVATPTTTPALTLASATGLATFNVLGTGSGGSLAVAPLSYSYFPTSGATAGSYGTTTTVPTFTVNAQGILTASSSVSIAFPVTSVAGSGGTTGLTLTGGTTGAVTLTLGGTLGIANGGSGQTTASAALSAFGGVPTTRNISTSTGLSGGGDLSADRTISIANTAVTAGAYGDSSHYPTFTVNAQGQLTLAGQLSLPSSGTGTVTSVAVSGGTTGLTTSGGPITTSGTITLAGTLAIANGGSGQTTASAALTAFGGVPTTRTVTAGTGLSGGGALSANISVALANTTVTAGTYGSATQVPVFSVNAQGQITGVTNTTITGGGSTSPGGSSTDVQINDSGAFYGDGGFTYNKTAKTASIGINGSSSGGYLSMLTLSNAVASGPHTGDGTGIDFNVQSPAVAGNPTGRFGLLYDGSVNNFFWNNRSGTIVGTLSAGGVFQPGTGYNAHTGAAGVTGTSGGGDTVVDGLITVIGTGGALGSDALERNIVTTGSTIPTPAAGSRRSYNSVSTSGGTGSVTLPSGASIFGTNKFNDCTIFVMRVGTNALTVNAPSGCTINGASTYVMSTGTYESIEVHAFTATDLRAV